MNAKLLRSCACLWFVGILGMLVVRALLELHPDALAFQLSARFFFVGGVGYTGLGLLGLATRDPRDRKPEAPASADLSALIRRR